MDKTEHRLMPKLAEACADDGEVLATAVIRFIAAGYMTGDVACWDAAFASAETVLGEAEAPGFVAGMASVMRALRAERRPDWRFLPATCCRVTEDELALIGLLACARRGDPQDLARGAAALAEQPAAPRLVAALGLAAGAIERAQARLEAGRHGMASAGALLH